VLRSASCTLAALLNVRHKIAVHNWNLLSSGHEASVFYRVFVFAVKVYFG